jgi:hypothetical protein
VGALCLRLHLRPHHRHLPPTRSCMRRAHRSDRESGVQDAYRTSRCARAVSSKSQGGKPSRRIRSSGGLDLCTALPAASHLPAVAATFTKRSRRCRFHPSSGHPRVRLPALRT